MKTAETVYEYITTEEGGFKLPIEVISGWSWNFPEHVRISILYKNSELETGKMKGTVDEKPVKNIVLPILNLRYRAEDIDIKDVVLYVDDPTQYHLSFLVKKYHDDVFVLENDLDTFFDEVKESKIDFGAGLIKDIGEAKPDIVALQSIAFCDQTDMLSGPICIKHQYTPDQLKEMEEVGWGDEKNGATATIDDVLEKAEQKKPSDNTDTSQNNTPTNYLEVYELHGVLPSQYLNEKDEGRIFVRQLHIVTFYIDTNNRKQGMTLFAKEEKKSPFKAVFGDKIYGRALPRGGVEELFEPQIWINYDMIRMKQMLDAVSKIIAVTDDGQLAARHPSGLKNLDNMELLEVAPGKQVSILNTYPRNLALFEKSVAEWEAHAQSIGAANDSILGKAPASGTPFKLQELVTAESHGLHDYRRGKYAKFIEEVYRDLILPYIASKISQGAEFLTELSSDEMEYLSDQIAENLANRKRNEQVLDGEIPEDKETLKEQFKQDFRKAGTKRFINILKDELKKAPLKVKVNVSNKQKDLSVMTDKLVNIFRFVFSTYDPNTQQFAVFQNKGMVKLFNQIIEHSGFSPVDFNFQMTAMPSPMQMQKGVMGSTESLEALAGRKESPIPTT